MLPKVPHMGRRWVVAVHDVERILGVKVVRRGATSAEPMAPAP
ncbi:MAG: hypothetical protein QM757_14740 [Paludibaculum sp.]